MKLILFSNDNVGKQALCYLSENFIDDLQLVVTTEKNDIYDEARKKNIRCFSLKDDGDLITEITESKLKFDLGILAWRPKIICSEIMSLAPSGFINFHPSLLPYNRGKNYNF